MEGKIKKLYELQEIADLEWIEGTPFPKGIKTSKLIVTGTPGSGKTMLVQKIKGWPEEGYLDISSRNWWKSKVFQLKPREIHFGLPFFGHDKSFPVYDMESLNALSRLELDVFRIPLPKPYQGILSVDWRNKFIFEFQILPAEKIFSQRKQRAEGGSHHVDKDLTLERVEEEVNVYRDLALFFHRAGWAVYLREDYNGTPKKFTEKVQREADIEHLYQDLVRKRTIYEEFDHLKLRQQLITRTWRHQFNKELMEFFTDILPKIMEAERCSIFIHDPQHKKIWLKCGTNVGEKEIEVSREGAIVGEVIKTGKAVIKNKLEEVTGIHKEVDQKTGFVTRNLICVPILSLTSSETAGAIEVLNKQANREFDDEDKQMLERAAYHLEMAAENAFLSQDMLDFSALLSHQVQKSSWMVTWWGIGLWVLTAVTAGAVSWYLLMKQFPDL